MDGESRLTSSSFCLLRRSQAIRFVCHSNQAASHLTSSDTGFDITSVSSRERCFHPGFDEYRFSTELGRYLSPISPFMINSCVFRGWASHSSRSCVSSEFAENNPPPRLSSIIISPFHHLSPCFHHNLPLSIPGPVFLAGKTEAILSDATLRS